MQRSKRIVLVSHCVLNQNTVIEGEARSKGAISSMVEWVVQEELGIVQLPCPEFTYLGLNRPPMTYREYDTLEYRKHCRSIIQPVIDQIEEYLRNDFELVGLMGIESSPSCDPRHGRGVFMEELIGSLKELNIDVNNKWYLPNSDNPMFNSIEHLFRQ
ncbi:hypothetical protein HHO41_21790 [Bacillus sp. DNRA2]|uniref:CD3072 family TudS-related putative desulfidase n=1 Tax=Bacillus sp. DNRA2 TaxID=2723053 RepID=UPI00145F8906|nr:CD3072 family TudS-related putative desulfidase [Bacillus sp. DNRA2]NMD72854.1 hypothetical protein [Bacillus sp. DNRA2]